MALPSQSERSTPAGRSMASRPAGVGANKTLVIVLLLVVLAAGAYALVALLPQKNQPPKGDPTLTKAPNSGTPAPNNAAGTTPSNVLGAQGPVGGDPATKFATPSGATPAADGTKPAPADVTQANATPGPIKVEPAPTPPAIVTPSASVLSVRAMMDAGEQAFAQGKLVEARDIFSRAYLDKDCAPLDRALIREKLTAINRDLLFSPKITPGDPLVEAYTVQSGDVLDRIRRKRELTVDSKFIARVNGMANPDVLKLGQKLKLVRGPFHAVVTKSEFRLDLFAGSPDEPESWTYIRSFSVGLGEGNSTPVGLFTIRNKMENPSWRNPRTGEAFAADDPKNPIGEYWLGWEGLGDSKIHTGFGVHGTIEPASIGKEMSMGCVRMATDDIALVYEMLSERVSLVRVIP